MERNEVGGIEVGGIEVGGIEVGGIEVGGIKVDGSCGNLSGSMISYARLSVPNVWAVWVG